MWANYKELALVHGLLCLLVNASSRGGVAGRVLGTFANYYRVVRDPSPADLSRFYEHAVTIAAVIVIIKALTSAPRPLAGRETRLQPAARRESRAFFSRSKRSRFITLFHAATKSRTNFSFASSLA